MLKDLYKWSIILIENCGISDSLEPVIPWNQWFQNNTSSLSKIWEISDSLESVVPWNHLIPSADETTVWSTYGFGTIGSRGSLVPGNP